MSSDKSSQGLKSCPFCGCDAELHSCESRGYHVICVVCMGSYYGGGRKSTINGWNKRSDTNEVSSPSTDVAKAIDGLAVIEGGVKLSGMTNSGMVNSRELLIQLEELRSRLGGG